MSAASTPAIALLAAFVTACVSGWLLLRKPMSLRVMPSGNNPCHCAGAKLAAGAVPVWVALLSCVFAVRWYWPIVLVLLFTLGMSIVGYIDDHRPYEPFGKVRAQSLPLVLGAFTLSGLFASHSYAWSMLLWFTALLVSSNAMNVVDVADGLAPGIATMTLSAVALITFEHRQLELSRLASIFASSTAAFLVFNAAPGRLILGDTGSLALGGLCALLAPHCIAPDQPWGLAIVPLLLFVPLLEVCWLSVRRIRRGIAPWRASPHHLAHWLTAKGLSTPIAVAALVLLHTLSIGLALWLLRSRYAMPWLVASAFTQTAIFWGKYKWSKKPKQRLRIPASQ